MAIIYLSDEQISSMAEHLERICDLAYDNYDMGYVAWNDKYRTYFFCRKKPNDTMVTLDFYDNRFIAFEFIEIEACYGTKTNATASLILSDNLIPEKLKEFVIYHIDIFNKGNDLV